MADWNGGYVTDINYTFGYQMELNPLNATFALLSSGYVPPALGTHCELGFGQGISVNIHAAASGSEWYGTDFNPAQVAFAKELANVSGSSIHLYDESFEEFCARSDLPEFDSICLHGIWSWISEENRIIITKFIRKKLKIGGVLYISYNTQPGWAAMVPMRDLLSEYAQFASSESSGLLSRIDASLQFAEKLMETKPLYAVTNPIIAERLKQIKNQNKNYVAHEFFGGDWLPISFARMARYLESTKVNFACSARLLDHVDFINLEPEQRELIDTLPDPYLKQTVRDFCVNQQFRRDYWIKGLRKLDIVERNELLRALTIILIQPRPDVLLEVKGKLGNATMKDPIYEMILDRLSNHQPTTLGDLEKNLLKTEDFQKIIQALLILAGIGVVVIAQNPEVSSKINQNCRRLNDHLIRKTRGGADVSYLASPVTGGGIHVSRLEQLFIGSIRAGYRLPEEWAADVWKVMSPLGKLVKEGKKLETNEENLSEITSYAKKFASERLPLLNALMVV
jgi:hypothetical protein